MENPIDTTQPTTDDNPEMQESTAQSDEIASLKAVIAQLQIDVKDAKEAQARANADSYNAQKRMESETEKAKRFALQKFAKDLLDVVDNLERAIASAGENTALVEGILLTHKSLLDILARHGVSAIDPVGEKFNPEHHEAVGIDPNAAADTVGVVLQKGYLLHDRLLRPAMVQVGQ